MARRYCDSVPSENFLSDASTRICGRCEASRACASLLLATQDLSIKTHSAVHLSFSAAFRRGWRPPRPMARGGQRPTVEPAFQVLQSSPPSHLQLQSLPPSLTRFLYHREVDNLLSTALDADEEALAVARAALESSEAESEEEPPEEQAGSPILSPGTQEPTLAVDSIGIRLVPWGSVHAVQCTHGNSVQTACGLHLKHCSYPVHQIHPDMQLCKRKARMAVLC